MTQERFLLWRIDETAGFDAAWATIDGGRLSAEGRATGQRPFPWWTSYRLETAEKFITARLVVESRWADGSATLELRRDQRAGWTVNGEARPDLHDALDCDLGACPLTNTMPVLRHGLLERDGDHRLVMAFVEVPSLRVVRSDQRYTRLRDDDAGPVITYRSGSFRSDLTFDRDGFVIDYPQLGQRVAAGASTADVERVRAAGPGSVRPV